MSNRVLKEPAVRKQEILDTAMLLFREKGYDATSISDIAKAMNVVPGLCYRYFKNKKEIFDEAVKQYAAESCQDVLEIVRDHDTPFRDRIDKLGQIMIHKEDDSRHHEFFHASGNETFHLQLAIEMYKYLAPHISKELARLHDQGEVYVEDPELMTEFLLFGQVNLWVSPSLDPHSPEFLHKVTGMRQYMFKLLELK